MSELHRHGRCLGQAEGANLLTHAIEHRRGRLGRFDFGFHVSATCEIPFVLECCRGVLFANALDVRLNLAARSGSHAFKCSSCRFLGVGSEYLGSCLQLLVDAGEWIHHRLGSIDGRERAGDH